MAPVREAERFHAGFSRCMRAKMAALNESGTAR